MHSANSSQRLPSLLPATLCEMPAVLHTQGIYFTHKEVMLVGCEGRDSLSSSSALFQERGFIDELQESEKGGMGEKGFMHCTGVIVTRSMYTCVSVCGHTHRMRMHIHLKLNFP